MWPSMQRWQCPIYNGTFESFIWSIMKNDFVGFLGSKVFNSDNSMQCLPAAEIICSKIFKHWNLIDAWSDTAFQGTVVNRTLPSWYREPGHTWNDA